jgi:predicted flap endonuclease-1-like 5' DNA nuclease
MRTLAGFVVGIVVGWYLIQIWVNRREPLPLEPARDDSTPVPEHQSGMPEPEPSTVAVSPDDLTQIKGIGPVFQDRLNEAGITTYEQLAATAPDQVRQIIAAADWQKIEPERWVHQAAQLVTSSPR